MITVNMRTQPVSEIIETLRTTGDEPIEIRGAEDKKILANIMENFVKGIAVLSIIEKGMTSMGA